MIVIVMCDIYALLHVLCFVFRVVLMFCLLSSVFLFCFFYLLSFIIVVKPGFYYTYMSM